MDTLERPPNPFTHGLACGAVGFLFSLICQHVDVAFPVYLGFAVAWGMRQGVIFVDALFPRDTC